MSKTSQSGVTAVRTTLAFATVCLLAFIIAIGLLLAQAYRDGFSRAETRARAYSQVVSANVGLMVEGTYQALRRIDSAAGDALLAAPSENAVGNLNQAVENLPVNVRAWLIDANGRPRLSNTNLSSAFSVADRDYFKGVKNGDPFRISPLVISRTAGDAIVPIAKRIERNGKFVGAAVIIVPASYLDQLRDPLELGPKSTLSIIRNDGQLVTRSPVPSEAQDLSDYVLFTSYLPKADEGTYTAVSPTDGVERIVAYRRVPGAPLVAIASMGTDEALKPFYQTAITLGLFAIPGLAGLGIFAFRTLQSQRSLARLLEQNQALLGEIHHRVKNNLQQAIALVRLQALPADASAELTRRFMAMAAVHQQMYRREEYSAVLASEILPELADQVRQSLAKDIAITTKVDPVQLERDQAMPLALIVSELLANAAKHAFPDDKTGTVDVSLVAEPDDMVRLTVSDNGIGFAEGHEPSGGTGTKLIRMFSRQLGADPQYSGDGGVQFTIVFPLSGANGQ